MHVYNTFGVSWTAKKSVKKMAKAKEVSSRLLKCLVWLFFKVQAQESEVNLNEAPPFPILRDVWTIRSVVSLDLQWGTLDRFTNLSEPQFSHM